MNPVEIIIKKRNGKKLCREEIEYFFQGYMGGKLTDYQMAAFLMAVYFQKMDFEETTNLTEVMLKSGQKIDLSFLPFKKVGKHSTGGVGDKVSIILAPMVASCGVYVPMISGRALGHTGGTLDKLESIPGFRTDLKIEEYKKILSEVGVVMGGQTEEVVPIDKKIYAIRDVTGTVESISLIASSIMSKKLAEGIDSLVLDIKTGRGAFLSSEQDALNLADTLLKVGQEFDLKSIAFITDMNQPLGYAIGNWIEITECIECLQGKNIQDLMEVTYVLGGAMLFLSGKARSIEDGISQCRLSIHSGKAWEKFKEMVKSQRGNIKYIENPGLYSKTSNNIEIKSPFAGDIDDIDALEIGRVSVLIGCGRIKMGESIDPAAGILLKKKIGDNVEVGEPLAVIMTNRLNKLDEVRHRLARAFRIATEPSVSLPLIHAMVDDRGVHPWYYCV